MDNRVWRKQNSAEAGNREPVENDAGSCEFQNSNNSGSLAGASVRDHIVRGTGVPDDCRIDTGFRAPSLRELLFKDIQASALHADTLNPVTSRIRILPAHGVGVVIELRLKVEGMDGLRFRHTYILPDTVLRTERGAVAAADLVEGDQLPPDYAEVTAVRLLFVSADFCRPVSVSPVYVDLGGMYVLTTRERN